MSEDITLVTITTDLIDVYTAPRVREALVDVINQGRYFLVVDFTAVDSTDSTGLGVLVGGLKRVRAHHGALVVVVPGDRARKMFRITGLSKVFPIFDTVDHAVEFLGREFPRVRLSG
ncbi:STAS domain-containing protein [Streptomyces sp. NPDC002698]|uniref:STAS domain-containing protein n=1 Tax=Streptomyces sp. NPDC002698 TaxID=3364660 RepID=UPI0036C380C3